MGRSTDTIDSKIELSEAQLLSWQSYIKRNNLPLEYMNKLINAYACDACNGSHYIINLYGKTKIYSE